jgi:hypothetical protein
VATLFATGALEGLVLATGAIIVFAIGARLLFWIAVLTAEIQPAVALRPNRRTDPRRG